MWLAEILVAIEEHSNAFIGLSVALFFIVPRRVK